MLNRKFRFPLPNFPTQNKRRDENEWKKNNNRTNLCGKLGKNYENENKSCVKSFQMENLVTFSHHFLKSWVKFIEYEKRFLRIHTYIHIVTLIRVQVEENLISLKTN